MNCNYASYVLVIGLNNLIVEFKITRGCAILGDGTVNLTPCVALGSDNTRRRMLEEVG